VRRALFIVLAFWLPAVAAAETPSPSLSDEAAIRDVIVRQLEAFQRDDGSAAFALASPTIQRKFGNPDTFMEMVRRGYRPVYRPRAVRLGTLTQADGRLTQEVFLVGPDGRQVLALYFMARQPDGTWRIDGVRLTRSPEPGV